MAASLPPDPRPPTTAGGSGTGRVRLTWERRCPQRAEARAA
ncbi:MAG: hypothetical protein ACRDRV_15485 [Pseudonocardiaceae bacterium]